MSTNTQEIHNMRLIAHSDLNGFGNGGEGMSLQQASNGRRILWIAHESGPKDATAVDVTDIANPRMVAQTELPFPHVRSNSLAVVGDTMLVAYQTQRPGQEGAGMAVFRRKRPHQPQAKRVPGQLGPLLQRGPLLMVG